MEKLENYLRWTNVKKKKKNAGGSIHDSVPKIKILKFFEMTEAVGL